jgi:hypothetical protein
LYGAHNGLKDCLLLLRRKNPATFRAVEALEAALLNQKGKGEKYFGGLFAHWYEDQKQKNFPPCNLTRQKEEYGSLQHIKKYENIAHRRR